MNLFSKSFNYYRYYLAIKLHFKNEDYDFFKNLGRTRTSEAAFKKRNDRYFFEKLAATCDLQRYLDKCLTAVLIDRNFTPKNLLSKDNENLYLRRRGILEAFLPKLDAELSVILTLCLNYDISFLELFEGTAEKKPSIYTFYKKGIISNESFVCLYQAFDCLSESLAKFSLDPLVDQTIKFVEKYTPFVSKYFPPNQLVKENVEASFAILNNI